MILTLCLDQRETTSLSTPLPRLRYSEFDPSTDRAPGCSALAISLRTIPLVIPARYPIADLALRALYVFIVNGIKLSVKGRTHPSNSRNRYTVTRAPDEIQYVPRITVAIICSDRTVGSPVETTISSFSSIFYKVIAKSCR